jgi:hypothetical protein
LQSDRLRAEIWKVFNQFMFDIGTIQRLSSKMCRRGKLWSEEMLVFLLLRLQLLAIAWPTNILQSRTLCWN